MHASSLRRLLPVIVAVVALIPGSSAPRTVPVGELSHAPVDGFVQFRSANTHFLSIDRRMVPVEEVTIRGRISLPPEPGADAVPAVVMIHGSGGFLWDHMHQYVEVLNEAGFATFAVDSFGPRHIAHTMGRQHLLDMDNHLYDAFRALEVLRTHPAIDPDRIGITGWSRGGIVSLDAWFERNRLEYIEHNDSDPDLRFAAHFPVYPHCGGQEAELVTTGAPLTIALGGVDDWTGVVLCEILVERVRDAGGEIDLLVYEGAHHSFDYPGTFHRRVLLGHSAVECGWIRGQDHFTDLMTGERFPWGEDREVWAEWWSDCVSPGVTVASHPEARARVLQDIRAFFESALQ